MNIKELFNETKTIGNGSVTVSLRVRCLRIDDTDGYTSGSDPRWLDVVVLFADSANYSVKRPDVAREATDYLLLNRDPSQTMDVRVCFSEDYGTWAQIVGAESDAQAIRRTINKLDSIWVVCQPILEEFLAQYKPDDKQEGTQAT